MLFAFDSECEIESQNGSSSVLSMVGGEISDGDCGRNRGGTGGNRRRFNPGRYQQEKP